MDFEQKADTVREVTTKLNDYLSDKTHQNLKKKFSNLRYLIESPLFARLCRIRQSLDQLEVLSKTYELDSNDFDVDFRTGDLELFRDMVNVKVKNEFNEIKSSTEPQNKSTSSLAHMKQTLNNGMTMKLEEVNFQGGRVEKIILRRGATPSLGLTLTRGKDKNVNLNGFFVEDIQPDGIADRDGRLEPGDQVLAINEKLLESSMSDQEIMELLQKSNAAVELIVGKSSTPAEIGKIIEEQQMEVINNADSVDVQDEEEEEDDEMVEIIPIHLVNDGSGLGFGIVRRPEGGVMVKTVLPGSVAEKDGRLNTGDHILQIEDEVVKDKSTCEVASILKHLGINVKLVVGRAYNRLFESQGSKVVVPVRHLDEILTSLNTGKSAVATRRPGDSRENLTDTPDSDDDDDKNVIFEVDLTKDSSGLGMVVIGCPAQDGSVRTLISEISPGSVVEKDGRIKVGDEILEVNGESIKSNAEATFLRNSGTNMKLKILRVVADDTEVFHEVARAIPDNGPVGQGSAMDRVLGDRSGIQKQNSNESETSSETSEKIEELKEYWKNVIGQEYDIIVAKIVKEVKTSSLGISLNSGRRMNDYDDDDYDDDDDDDDHGRVKEYFHHIQEINPNGPIGREGSLKPGDRLLQVDSHALINLSHDRVASIIRGLDTHIFMVCARLPQAKVVLPRNKVPPIGHASSSYDQYQASIFDKHEISSHDKKVSTLMTNNYRLDGEWNLSHKLTTNEIHPHCSATDLDSSILSSDGPFVNNSLSSHVMSGERLWQMDLTYVDLVPNEYGLGYSVVAYENPDHGENSILIGGLKSGGAAELDGRLDVGDKIISVNNYRVYDFDSYDSVMKAATRSPVIIGVLKHLKSMPIHEPYHLPPAKGPYDHETPPISPPLDFSSKYIITPEKNHRIGDDYSFKPIQPTPPRSDSSAKDFRMSSVLPSIHLEDDDLVYANARPSIVDNYSATRRFMNINDDEDRYLGVRPVTQATMHSIATTTSSVFEESTNNFNSYQMNLNPNIGCPTSGSTSNISVNRLGLSNDSLRSISNVNVNNANNLMLGISDVKVNSISSSSINNIGVSNLNARHLASSFNNNINDISNLIADDNRPYIHILHQSNPSDMSSSSSMENFSSYENKNGRWKSESGHVASLRKAFERKTEQNVEEIFRQHFPSPTIQKTQPVVQRAQSQGEPRLVDVYREGNQGLGISIVGGSTVSSKSAGVFIKNVFQGSPAGKPGKLMSGDQILEVNGTNCREATHEQVVEIIKSASNPIWFLLQNIQHQQQIQHNAPSLNEPVRGQQNYLKYSRPGEADECEPKFGSVNGDVITLEIDLGNPATNLGLILTGNRNLEQMNTFVAAVQPGSAADLNGGIIPGDELLEINDQTFQGRSHLNASYIIKSLKTQTIKIVLSRNPENVEKMAINLKSPLSPKLTKMPRRSVGDVALSNEKRPSDSFLSVEVDNLKRAKSAEFLSLPLGTLAGTSRTSSTESVNANETPPQEILGLTNSLEKKLLEGPARPSTLKHSSDSELMNIEIPRGNDGLGISIIGGSDTLLGCIVVSDIYANGAADKDGRLKVGDILVKVNNSSLEYVTKEKAMNYLRQGPSNILLSVYRPKDDLMSSGDNFETFNVDLNKRQGQNLGITIIGRHQDSSICVCEILKGGLAEADGRLQPGDEVLLINKKSFKGQEAAAELLKAAQGMVRLTVKRPWLRKAAAIADKVPEKVQKRNSKIINVKLSRFDRGFIMLQLEREDVNKEDSSLVIKQIEGQESIARQFMANDKIISINGITTDSMSPKVAMEMIQSSSSHVSFDILRDPQYEIDLTKDSKLTAGPLIEITNSSSQHEDDEHRIKIVTLYKESSGYGFSVVGGCGSNLGDLPLFVKNVFEGGVAARDGRLKKGDRLVAVNGETLEGLDHSGAVAMLKRCRGTVVLTVMERKL